MANRTQRAVEKPWGSYTTDQADIYYDKLGIECATKEEYRNWFMKAERANTPCRRLQHFCEDCLLSYELKMAAAGKCAKAKRKAQQESEVE